MVMTHKIHQVVVGQLLYLIMIHPFFMSSTFMLLQIGIYYNKGTNFHSFLPLFPLLVYLQFIFLLLQIPFSMITSLFPFNFLLSMDYPINICKLYLLQHFLTFPLVHQQLLWVTEEVYNDILSPVFQWLRGPQVSTMRWHWLQNCYSSFTIL
jgi:hypothetical protein